MGTSYFDEAEEAQGHIPALTGALVEITGIERSKTGERSKNPGCRMYVISTKVVEPKKYAGTPLTGWYVVGTADDPNAKEKSTWEQGPRSGVARLKRILVRSGTPISKDDEEWMEAAEGHQFVVPVTLRVDENGTQRNGLGDIAYRQSDEDCPVIGEAEARGKGKLKAVKKAKAVAEDEDEDDTTTKAKDVGNGNKRAAKPADDDDED